MADRTITATVTRDLITGSPADLSLENPGSYRIVDFDIGGLSWRRATVESPYQHGNALVGAVKDIVTSMLLVRCYGSSASDLDTKVAALVVAFEQFTYNVRITIDGVAWEWKCQPADIAPNNGQPLDKFAYSARQQVYALHFPRSPVQVSGSL